MRRVTAITSKSYVHRLLIAAALCGEKITVVTNIVSDDMRATISALESLGAVTDTVFVVVVVRVLVPLTCQPANL